MGVTDCSERPAVRFRLPCMLLGRTMPLKKAAERAGQQQECFSRFGSDHQEELLGEPEAEKHQNNQPQIYL